MNPPPRGFARMMDMSKKAFPSDFVYRVGYGGKGPEKYPNREDWARGGLPVANIERRSAYEHGFLDDLRPRIKAKVRDGSMENYAPFIAAGGVMLVGYYLLTRS